MADFPRFDELFDIALEEMVARCPDLQPAAIRQEGTHLNALCAAIATVGEELVRRIAIVSRDRLLTTAQGEELDRLVWDWYGLQRHDAGKAVASVRFSRTGSMSGTIQEGHPVATEDGVEFELIEQVVFATGELTKWGVVRAVVAGVAGNVAANKIRVMRRVAFDPSLSVTNPEPASGGSERESDDALRARARAYWAVVRRGTLAAIEYGAQSVEGCGIARATEATLITGTGQPAAKWVSLVVADQSGRANTLLRDAVSQALDEWRPCGVYVAVLPAEIRYQRVRASCAFRAGADTVAARSRLRQALVTYVNSLRIGERLLVGGLLEVVRADRDVAMSPVPQVIEPTGDVVPVAYEIIRTSEDMVLINV